MDRFGGGSPLDSFAAFAGAQGSAPSMRGPLPPPPGSIVIPPGGGQPRPYYPGDQMGMMPQQGPPQMGGGMMPPQGAMPMPGMMPPQGMPPVMPGPMAQPVGPMGGAPQPQMATVQDPILMQILMQHLARQQQEGDEYQRGRAFMTQLLASKLGQ